MYMVCVVLVSGLCQLCKVNEEDLCLFLYPGLVYIVW